MRDVRGQGPERRSDGPASLEVKGSPPGPTLSLLVVPGPYGTDVFGVGSREGLFLDLRGSAFFFLEEMEGT